MDTQGFDNRPLYNSVDASLLLFEQIQKIFRIYERPRIYKRNI